MLCRQFRVRSTLVWPIKLKIPSRLGSSLTLGFLDTSLLFWGAKNVSRFVSGKFNKIAWGRGVRLDHRARDEGAEVQWNGNNFMDEFRFDTGQIIVLFVERMDVAMDAFGLLGFTLLKDF